MKVRSVKSETLYFRTTLVVAVTLVTLLSGVQADSNGELSHTDRHTHRHTHRERDGDTQTHRVRVREGCAGDFSLSQCYSSASATIHY